MASLISLIKEKNQTTPTWLKVLVPFLALGGLGAVAVMGAIGAFIITAWLGQPVPVLGFDQTFEQPIHFPHTVHAGTGVLLDENGNPRVGDDGEELHGLGLDCTFCHRTVDAQASAGVPPVTQCTFCHRVIGDAENPELEKLRVAGGITSETASPINWRRVHRMPDHVRFVHEPHIRYLTANPDAIRNITDPAISDQASALPAQVCSTCHGDVAAMEQVEQVEPLKMGQCVDCHRDNEAPTDCAACHH
ncbi:MAG: hypothetical protein WD208_04290 [Dehalococcoidia bacterium]